MKNKFPAAFIRVFLIFAVIFIATEIIVPSEGVAFTQPAVASFLLIVLLFLIIAEKIKDASEKLFTDHIPEEDRAAYYAEKDKKAIKDWSSLMQALGGSRAVNDEEDIILDHDYDGIKELDNDLPPWWLYMFYGTILFAVAYLGYYEVFDGENQIDEYNEQVIIAQKEIEAYQKTVKPIDLNALEAGSDSAALNKGKKLFKQNCAACHMVDGRGSIGPNLTDEYWILGGGIKNIYNTIANGGRDGKGMIAWKNSLSAEKIQQVSSYVWSLQGTNPEKAKAAEGDKWTE
jgi:cytochrome c oxidase cbb3-type subunit 3